MPAFDPILGRIRDKRRLHNAAWAGSYEYLQHEHHQRERRIYKQIMHDSRRRFAATAIPYTSGEGVDVMDVFYSHGHLGAGSTSVYFCDGSLKYATESDDGLSASAVVWQDETTWMKETTAHPRYSGQSNDAELYAVNMAFEVALRHISDPKRNIDNIVIFTDSQDIVMMLAGEADCKRPLGPIPTNGRWALEDIYSAAEQLEVAGKKVVVAWIKGHKKGQTGTEGNRKADKAASSAIKMLKDHLNAVQPPPGELPEWVEGLEGDVWDEALWRLSKSFFRWGSGVCWISPSLQYGNGVEGTLDAEEEDWTVYRPIMTLKEAQKEDAAELRRYMAVKHLEGRPLPRKEHTSEVETKKAPPLKHLYRQAKPLPIRPKQLDYAKVYRQVLDV
jgi:ribonuclease HI